MIVNLRCPYCYKTEFRSFDEVHFHIYGLTTDVVPTCKAMTLDDVIRFDKWWSKYD